MNKLLLSNRIIATVSVLALSILLLTQCISNTPPKTIIINNKGEQYAGSQACTSCHATICNSFEHTAHQLTSAPGEKETIKGSFEQDNNVVYFNLYDRVVMEERDSGLYQVRYYKNEAKEAARMDMVIGSSTKGQSYLYWNHNALYELPVSYFAASDNWSNSPGNSESIVFNRAVFARCLECHTTYAKQLNNSISQFDKSNIIYGVTCESCHGAAAKHVQFQQQHPEAKEAKYIINPAKLSRQQQVDQCGLCHSGIQQNIQPAFTFMPGDTLSYFYKAKDDTLLANDVHGNKYALLHQSACFKNSQTITCNTCHDTHQNQRGKTAVFSATCMTCHTEANHNFCKLAPAVGAVIKTNCIDCHMPQKPSSILSVYLPAEGKTVAAQIRTHFIKVYPEETAKVLRYLKH